MERMADGEDALRGSNEGRTEPKHVYPKGATGMEQMYDMNESIDA